MSHDIDRDILDALVAVPGALKLVIPTRRPGKEEADPKDPASYVWEDVTGIEDHPDAENKPGKLRAVTAEGSWCDGTAEALLRKLQDWR